MLNRTGLNVLLLVGLVLPMVGCGSSEVDSVSISPSAQSLAAGQTVQLTATGTYGHGSHPSTSKNVTSLVTWSSSVQAVASVNSSGLVTAVSAGSTTVTASMSGFTGAVSGTAVVTVTGTTTKSISSLTIIPASQNVGSVNETGQFIAIGVTSAGLQEDMTNLVTWGSSDVKVATINGSGLATGLYGGDTTISAIAKNQDGSVATATATFTEGASGSGPILATLSVYKLGNNAATGTVTASAPGTTTPLVINCGSGSGCVGNFPLGSIVTLTATPGTNSTFGGWSSTCTAVQGSPNLCQVALSDNDTVGAIFN